jgi:hypothetical protein
MSKNERMNITEFLEARIAEDESRANAWQSRLDDLTIPAYMIGGTINPARLLAECAAKRAIIRSYQSCREVDVNTNIVTEFGVKLTASGMATGLEIALKSLAAVYADHPDYQPEWAV